MTLHLGFIASLQNLSMFLIDKLPIKNLGLPSLQLFLSNIYEGKVTNVWNVGTLRWLVHVYLVIENVYKSFVNLNSRRGFLMPHEASETPNLLSPGEVAELFRVDPKTVTRWAKAGKLSPVKTLGGHRRYHAHEVHELLRKIQEK